MWNNGIFGRLPSSLRCGLDIDDVFCIWDADVDSLNQFVFGINRLKPRLRFTAEISTQEAVFLDLRIYKGPDFDTTHKLSTDIYYKNINTFPTCTAPRFI